MSKENLSEGLAQRLLYQIQRNPSATYCEHVSFDGELEVVTRQQLYQRVQEYAATFRPLFQSDGQSKGENKRIGLCLYPGKELHAAFWGAIWAGAIPTILAPPSPRMESSKYSQSFQKMLHHIAPQAFVLDPTVCDKLAEHELLDAVKHSSASTHYLNPLELQRTDKELAPHQPGPGELALLQHSSGTTSLQKGVALSHQGILRHNQSYSQRLQLSADDKIATWLPLYHDMGLIACFLLPTLEGIPFIEMSPFDWVRRPAMLMEQIHRSQSTLCWLPNFAFSFLAKNIRRLDEACSVQSIRSWINCSEPVYWSSMDEFFQRFSEHGVRREQFAACYAMAENVFAVSQSLPGQPKVLLADRLILQEQHRIVPKDQTTSAKVTSEDPTSSNSTAEALAFVSNGTPIDGISVRVVISTKETGAAFEICEERAVGELEVHGEFSFSGYFGRDDLTQQAISDDGWYKTGDLGFIHEGEIYVTGRKKDLLIIQGRNLYPSDIEDSVGRMEEVVEGRVAAFSVPDQTVGTERLIVLAELLEEHWDKRKRISLKIRNHIAQELDTTASEVHIVPQRWLIKSTSGKLARNDNRNKYLKEIVQKESNL